jgi:AbrB family looped-hinge helix DNA binding protein
MGLEATVTSKGQLVIPVELRRRHYIKAGTRVQFQDVEGGILIRPVTKEYIHSLCGSLAGRGIPEDEEQEPDREIE